MHRGSEKNGWMVHTKGNFGNGWEDMAFLDCTNTLTPSTYQNREMFWSRNSILRSSDLIHGAQVLNVYDFGRSSLPNSTLGHHEFTDVVVD